MVEVTPQAVLTMRRSQEAANRVAAVQVVYGRGTGVGAAREAVTGVAHGGRLALDLWRSHAAGWGPTYDAAVVRAALAVRANQLAIGRAGASAELALALAALAGAPEGELPVVHRHGGLGTGDLTALAEIGLTLAGERPGADGLHRAALVPTAGDGLALLSSNAVTIAHAALLAAELRRMARAALVVAALSWRALRGSIQPVSPGAEAFCPFRGAVLVMRSTRVLLAVPEPETGQASRPASRPASSAGVAPDVAGPPISTPVQDFFGLRAWPQAHGPLLDRLDELTELVRRLTGTAPENPAFTSAAPGGGAGPASPDEATHHGGFHTAYLAGSVEGATAAAARSAGLILSRVSHLLTDRGSGLPLFLAGRPGGSGVLVGEYVAASALARIRAATVAPQAVALSRGVEDDAPFTPLLVERLAEVVPAYRQMLGVELTCAVRALRLRDEEVPTMLSGLPDDVSERDLAADFATACELLDDLGRGLAGGAGGKREAGSEDGSDAGQDFGDVPGPAVGPVNGAEGPGCPG